jgi:predicted metalloprotease with PDZ domain
MPFKAQSLQRLHEQLRHELFHLWIPNAVSLSGNYDWFYEGFALYMSLRSGVLGGRIRFEDMLDTLSRAYNIEAAQPAGISLIQASKQRWNGGNTQVYARGMLVAFLCDLTLLENSKGKLSIADVVRELYAKYRKPSAVRDGEEAVIETLRSHAELGPIVAGYVSGGKKIAWQQELSAAGIESGASDAIADLKVMRRPNSRQKKILDRLGYNSWRSAPRTSK